MTPLFADYMILCDLYILGETAPFMPHWRDSKTADCMPLCDPPASGETDQGIIIITYKYIKFSS